MLRGDEIDTDRIIPARFMKVVTFDTASASTSSRTTARQAKGDHALDDERFDGASILDRRQELRLRLLPRARAAGADALAGFRAFIGESFAEIFAGNCTALGLVCAPLAEADVAALMESIDLDPTQEITIDVQAGTVTSKAGTMSTTIASGTRQQLVEGTWDATGLLLDAGNAIESTADRLPYVKGYPA